ncbi:three-helix bundle dimerization domain-containing protein [Mycobacterium sp. AT1]|uniref:three-helix bundle dimerization domain-containing protein n=1 Tax=Mycobacterium sp. AT1 TaxID=1961706 RepID=UPI0035122882
MNAVDAALAQPLVRDELGSVVAMLCARFPERTPREIERLVNDSYQRLWENARIHAHLIPLTVNRCRRLLSGPASACSGRHLHLAPVHVTNGTSTGDAA